MESVDGPIDESSAAATTAQSSGEELDHAEGAGEGENAITVEGEATGLTVDAPATDAPEEDDTAVADMETEEVNKEEDTKENSEVASNAQQLQKQLPADEKGNDFAEKEKEEEEEEEEGNPETKVDAISAEHQAEGVATAPPQPPPQKGDGEPKGLAKKGSEGEEAGQQEEKTKEDGTAPSSKNKSGVAATPLPHVPEQVIQALEQIKKHNMWDTTCWQILLLHAQSTEIKKAREIYEQFFKVFPTASAQWKIYAERELLEQNFKEVDDIFKRCLEHNPDVELWRTYLKYVRATNKGKDEEAQAVKEAFEFTLKHLGSDFSAGPVWIEYADMIKAIVTENEFHEQEKKRDLRNIYQRAVCLPTSHIERLWQDYDLFEHSFENKSLAPELMAQFHPRYLAAKQDSKERQRRRRNLQTNLLAVPVNPGFRTGEEEQVRQWRQYIHYECNFISPLTESNRRNTSQQPGPDLPPCATKKGRALLAYRQALCSLRWHPQIWREASLYCSRQGDMKMASKLLEDACDAMPANLLMGLIYAEYLEKQKQIEKATDLYKRLKERVKSEDKTLAWIQWMKFMRRCVSVDAARKVFVSGMRSGVPSWQFCIEAAKIERMVNKDSTWEKKILAIGYKKYADVCAFVNQYSKYLLDRSDTNNLRAVFSRALDGRFPPEKAKEIWDRYIQFERDTNKEIEKIEEAERRHNEAFQIAPPPFPRPKMKSKKRKFEQAEKTFHTACDLADRLKSFDLLPCSVHFYSALARASGRTAPSPVIAVAPTTTTTSAAPSTVIRRTKVGKKSIKITTTPAPPSSSGTSKTAATTATVVTTVTAPPTTATTTTGTVTQASKRPKRVKKKVKVVVVAPTNQLPPAAQSPHVGPYIKDLLVRLLPPARLYSGPDIELSRLLDLIDFSLERIEARKRKEKKSTK